MEGKGEQVEQEGVSTMFQQKSDVEFSERRWLQSRLRAAEEGCVLGWRELCLQHGSQGGKKTSCCYTYECIAFCYLLSNSLISCFN